MIPFSSKGSWGILPFVVSEQKCTATKHRFYIPNWILHFLIDFPAEKHNS